MPTVLRIVGHLDIASLRRAFGEIVRRHNVLRCTLSEKDGVVLQTIHDCEIGDLDVHDLLAIDGERQKARVRRIVEDTIQSPFLLSQGPLYRVALVRLGLQESLLVLVIHHAITDGWSMVILARELDTLYSAFAAGYSPTLPEPAFQYSQFSIRQREHIEDSTAKQDLSYWREQLSNLSRLELAPERLPQKRIANQAARATFTIPAPLVVQLRGVGRCEGASLFMVLLTVFQILLQRYSAQDDVAVGTPVTERGGGDFDSVVGFFVNTLVLRTDLSGHPTFREALRRVRKTAFEAFSHYATPFDHIVMNLHPERKIGKAPFFSTIFSFLNFGPPEWRLANLTVTREQATTLHAKCDIELALTLAGDEIYGTLDYRSDLFESDWIDYFVAHYRRLLLSAGAGPDETIIRLQMTGTAEDDVLLGEWSATDRHVAERDTVCALFERQVSETPDTEAIVCGEERVTFRNLSARVAARAQDLSNAGVMPEFVVGVCFPRSIEMIVSMLAVMKAGGAYLPLDPASPDERLAEMLDDSGAGCVLTSPELSSRFAAYRGCLISDIGSAGQTSHRRDKRIPAADNAAYVLYTSGSTGKPKGVVVTHRNLANLFIALDAFLDAPNSSRTWLATTTCAFDISVLELLWTLARGYRVVLYVDDPAFGASAPASSGQSIAAQLRIHDVSHLQCTPSLVAILMESQENISALKSLSRLLIGGEVLSPNMAHRLVHGIPGDVLNMYGPTETTVWSSCYRIGRRFDGRSVPIGAPIANTRIYVLDDDLRLAGVEVPGEIYIAGSGVARGYINRPSLTADRFIPDPFSKDAGARMYRTGDRGRYRCDGLIDFLGRTDRQVKIRGHRVELGEIETVLRGHPAVVDTCVSAGGRNSGMTESLIAYVVLRTLDRHRPTSPSKDIRDFIGRKLPPYMVPSSVVILDAMPRTHSGKIDWKHLPVGQAVSATDDDYIEPRTVTEKAIATIWSQVLNVRRVGAQDDFFELGGHSLLAARIVTSIAKERGVHLALGKLFENSRLDRLAAFIDEQPGALRVDSISPGRPCDTPVLSFEQQDRLSAELRAVMTMTPYFQRRTCLNIELSGALDYRVLKVALAEIVKRHEVLRTAFSPALSPVAISRYLWALGRKSLAPKAARDTIRERFPFRQKVLPIAEIPFTEIVEADATEATIRSAAERVTRPFDYTRPPLIRAVLLKLGDYRHLLMIGISHLVSDGTSLRILQEELSSLYSAFAAGLSSSLPILRVQYADFARWQRQRLTNEAIDTRVAYWENRHRDFPLLTMDDLMFPPAASAGSARSMRQQVIEIPKVPADDLKAFARSKRVTLYTLLLAAYDILMHLLSRRSKFSIGTYFANRTHPDALPLIGDFAHAHSLSVDFSQDISLTELLNQLSETISDAYEHQDLPPCLLDRSRLDRLKRQDQSAIVTSVPIAFDFMTEAKCVNVAGVRIAHYRLPRVNSHLPFRAFCIDGPAGLTIAVDHDARRIDPAQVKDALDTLIKILAHMKARPDATVSGCRGLLHPRMNLPPAVL